MRVEAECVYFQIQFDHYYLPDAALYWIWRHIVPECINKYRIWVRFVRIKHDKSCSFALPKMFGLMRLLILAAMLQVIYRLIYFTPQNIFIINAPFGTKWTSSLYKANVGPLQNFMDGESDWNGNWYNLLTLPSTKIYFQTNTNASLLENKDSLSCLFLQ